MYNALGMKKFGRTLQQPVIRYLETLARKLEVPLETLVGKSRFNNYAGHRERRYAIYLLREAFGLSYPEISEIMGYASHHAALYHDQRIRADPKLCQRLNKLLPNRRYHRAVIWRSH